MSRFGERYNLYGYEDIKMVHLEVTSRCNASCPMCARNINGGRINPHLPLMDLSLDDVKKIFPVSFIKQLKKIYLCGNYGDPVAAQDTLEILRYFRESHPGLNLGLHTNGGLRSTDWWKQLASIVSYCRFGIDGLEDTNHLYRRNVQWSRLKQNVQAFVQAGGRAEWDYLLFAHNEHQVDTARALAQEWGFQDFQVKNTSRFFDKSTTQTRASFPVQNNEDQVIYELRPTSLPDYQNKALEKDYKEVVEHYGSVAEYWDRAEIQCRVAAEKSIYVSAEGLVFPCCWTAGQLYPSKSPATAENNEVLRLLENMPEKKQSLSALHHSAQEIIEGEFFQSLLPNSWALPSVKSGKLQVCAKTCGACVKPFESQFVSP
ncbi:radical SAM protein [Bdellovibrio sp. HCB2-146]|uniref:radical SAM protein n=1 Tax=Bdellovibrio sp. HCB2-146 TaxID=3394362 RepID=UPI0039BD736F